MKTKQKMLILHGWDWRKYPKFKPTHQWENRQELVNLLMKEFHVDYPDLPGFNINDSHDGEWSLDDYSSWLEKLIKENKYDVVLGYSFGCAVIIHCLHKYKLPIKSILISPAIIRAYTVKTSSTSSKVSSLLKRFRLNWVRSLAVLFYLKYVVKNDFYIHGTKFLRKTYQNIVRVDLSDECNELLEEEADLQFIFGSEDTATPPALLLKKTPKVNNRVHIIDNATHNVGGTHPKEVVSVIESLLLH
jgi:pimeloyl-ACP methyl ester carboxylesterase